MGANELPVTSEENRSKLISVWKTLAIIAALLYFGTLEMRVNNLQILNKMIYDDASCSWPGASKDKVRDCYRSRGYKISIDSQGSRDTVFPVGIADTFSLRDYSVEIKYDMNGILQSHSIDSYLGFL
jgi:hypothetical protein